MKPQDYSDYELVMQFINGSQESFETLIKRHKKKVFSYIYFIVRKRDLAEDIFQETFFKVIKSLREGRYTEDGKFISWVTRIAHNLIIDHFRKERNLKTVSNDDYELDIFNAQKFSEPTIEEGIIRTQIVKDVRNLIEQLPEEQKAVVIMRHYMGMSFKEIAEETDVSINTALGRMRYALINLRRLIDEKQLTLMVE